MKKKNNLKIGALLCTVCLFVLIYIPSVEGRVIEYPKEDGPYTIYIGGRTDGSGKYSDNIDFNSYLWPFWDLDSDEWIGYGLEGIAFLIVNGSLQKINFPASITFNGFKGFAPTYWMIILSLLFFPRIRVSGECESIIVQDSS